MVLHQQEAHRAVRRERASKGVYLAVDTLENAPETHSRQASCRIPRLVPIWSDDRRHFQGYEVAR
jgi:hypothetical protein